MKVIGTMASFVALFGFSYAAAATAQDRPFTLENGTNASVVAVYASPHGANNWRSDLLDGQPLVSGQSRAVTIAGGEGICAYDFRIEVEMSSGTRTLDRVQDLCALSVVTITP